MNRMNLHLQLSSCSKYESYIDRRINHQVTELSTYRQSIYSVGSYVNKCSSVGIAC